MKKMLIAAGSTVVTDELAEEFQNEYDVYRCSDGAVALTMMQDIKPDILIISLSLSHTSGLEVLQLATHKPEITIALTNYISDYIIQACEAAGVCALIRSPCSIDCIRWHLNKDNQLNPGMTTT